MPTKHVVLTDQARSLDWPELTLGSHEVGGPARGYLVHKRRLEGGLSSGVEMVEVDNGRLRFRLLPTRGMALWKAWLGDIEFGGARRRGGRCIRRLFRWASRVVSVFSTASTNCSPAAV